MFNLFISIYSFKVFNGIKGQDLMISINNILNFNYNLRSNKLSLPTVHINKYKLSIFYQVIISWNNLPVDIKNMASYLSFKRKFKEFLLSNY